MLNLVNYLKVIKLLQDWVCFKYKIIIIEVKNIKKKLICFISTLMINFFYVNKIFE